MNEFESLVESIKEQFPRVKLHIDEPAKQSSGHWLDVCLGDTYVTIEWRPNQGFGFFAKDAEYGEGPEEIILDKDGALKRVSVLLTP
ncbi:MAG: hypothetical protein V4697_02125 [Patescibacteria group bacterium]